jgi:hypothetical protein
MIYEVHSRWTIYQIPIKIQYLFLNIIFSLHNTEVMVKYIKRSKNQLLLNKFCELKEIASCIYTVQYDIQIYIKCF